MRQDLFDTRARTKPPIALGLLSGGLDSLLAVRILQEQGIEITGITFKTPFFGSTRGEEAARALDIPHRILDITSDHLEMVKAPDYGYGKNMNPCIDCHAMMFRMAGDLMGDLGANFLFSGEVLGQRPMSQNRNSLRLVENISGYAGVILRPLSARLLPETNPEKEGLVDRSRLLDIQGRSRTLQMELAETWGIKEFPSPGGGCLLTDPGFSIRLKEQLETDPRSTPLDVERLKVGRHFRLPGGRKAIVGRNHQENEQLRKLGREGDLFLNSLETRGPLALLEGGASPEDENLAAALVVRYGKDPGKDQPVQVRIEDKGESARIIAAFPAAPGEPEKYRVG